LDKAKPVTEHVFSVLSSSKVGRKSSVGEHLHLCYKFKLNQLGDHQYLSKTEFEANIFDINPGKINEIHNYINKESGENIFLEDEITIDDILSTYTIPIIIEKFTNVYDPSSKSYKNLNEEICQQENDENIDIIKLDLCFLQAPNPCGTNYINTLQNTTEWQQIRKNRITGSRLPALLGIYGQKQYDCMWDIVCNGGQERDLSNLENIKRGHFNEKEGICYFEKVSKATTKSCGFFKHPCYERFGSSPDALGPSGVLIEMKTRSSNSDSPLQSITAAYYMQCQLQMICTDAHRCILVSYHPETTSANFFLIQRNNILMSAVVDICNSILDKTILASWDHKETSSFKNLGQKLVGKKLNFEILKPLRVYINKCTKNIKQIEFIDNIVIDNIDFSL